MGQLKTLSDWEVPAQLTKQKKRSILKGNLGGRGYQTSGQPIGRIASLKFSSLDRRTPLLPVEIVGKGFCLKVLEIEVVSLVIYGKKLFIYQVGGSYANRHVLNRAP